MPTVRRARFVPTAIFLLLASGGLSGCTSAIIGVGTAAVAASTTEKGFSTSVADTQIHAKLTDRFIKTNFSLVTAVDVSVNDGAVLLTGKVKTPEEKILATKLTWEIRGVREVVNELQVTDSSSIKDIAISLIDDESVTCNSLTTSRTPRISHVNFVANIFSSGVFTLPVSRTAPSFTETSTAVTSEKLVLINRSVSLA